MSVDMRSSHSTNICLTGRDVCAGRLNTVWKAKLIRSRSYIGGSISILSANLREASTKIGSFQRTRACIGVLDIERRTTQNSRSGASNVSMSGGGTVRFQNVYID